MTFVGAVGDVAPVILGAFLAAAVIALLVTPVIRGRIHALEILDRPDARQSTRPRRREAAGSPSRSPSWRSGAASSCFGNSSPGCPVCAV